MTCYDKFMEKLKTIKHKKGLQALREERGAIFVLTALMLPVLLGCMGIAYDVGNLYMHKARLQNVTDAAALAGEVCLRIRRKKPNLLKQMST